MVTQCSGSVGQVLLYFQHFFGRNSSCVVRFHLRRVSVTPKYNAIFDMLMSEAILDYIEKNIWIFVVFNLLQK